MKRKHKNYGRFYIYFIFKNVKEEKERVQEEKKTLERTKGGKFIVQKND